MPAVLLLLLAAAACGGGADRAARGQASPPPAGFSADTFTREGLISGATATEAGCRALPDAVWAAAAGGRRECLRFGVSGDGQPGQRPPGGTAVVYIPGDPGGAFYRIAGGRPQVDGLSEHYELSPETRHAGADALSGAMGGIPVLLLARPGMHGSSGHHARDRQTAAEVELLDDALTQLRRRYGFRDLALVGFSSGGAVVANLLARRSDLRCAVIASAPLDLAQAYRRQDASTPDDFAMRRRELADPMATVGAIRQDAEVFVIGDRRDRTVPASTWEAWVAAARRAGLHVHVAEIAGLDRPELAAAAGATESRHHTSGRGLEVAQACASGVPPDLILRALRAEAPIIEPRGQRLRGPEIVAALAGRRLRATEWSPRVNVASHWEPDGTLTYLHLRNGERPIAALRWWVDGDRLCTTRHGCGAVLADGRFLHLLVEGDPPRLRVTLVMVPAPPPVGQGGS